MYSEDMRTDGFTSSQDNGFTTYRRGVAVIIGNEAGWSLYYNGEEILPAKGFMFKTVRGAMLGLRHIEG